MMALLSISKVTSYKDQVHPSKVGKQIRRCAAYNFCPENASRCFSPLADHGTRCVIIQKQCELVSQAKRRLSVKTSCMVFTSSVPFQSFKEVPPLYNTYSHERISGGAYQRARICSASYESETGSCVRQLKALDSYFRKLHGKKDYQLISCPTMRKLGTSSAIVEPPVESSLQLEGKMSEMIGSVDRHIASGLVSLDNYFRKLNTGITTNKSASLTSDEEMSSKNKERMSDSIIKDYHDRQEFKEELNNHEHSESIASGRGQAQFGDENINGLSTYDETSDFYIVGFLAAINIAVFLFEIASPIRNIDAEKLSLPLMYGGKINKLILDGEWWRLLTPMFLHSGFLHVALSCWVLLTFGPQVCRGYGPFTFILIYALGGIAGNLISFIHTPELTVCGTGPVFAIIGAWLVYQLQNKEVISKEVSESMFGNVVIVTALSFVLSNFWRIDNWTHLGATLSGIVFGYLTCPTLELDDMSSKNGQRDEVALVRPRSDLWKSLITFILSVLVISFLVFYYGPQLEVLELVAVVEGVTK